MNIDLVDRTTSKEQNIKVSSVEDLETLLEKYSIGTAKGIYFSEPFDCTLPVEDNKNAPVLGNYFLSILEKTPTVITKENWNAQIKMCYELCFLVEGFEYGSVVQSIKNYSYNEYNVPYSSVFPIYLIQQILMYLYLNRNYNKSKITTEYFNLFFTDKYKDILVKFLEIERKINVLLVS